MNLPLPAANHGLTAYGMNVLRAAIVMGSALALVLAR